MPWLPVSDADCKDWRLAELALRCGCDEPAALGYWTRAKSYMQLYALGGNMKDDIKNVVGFEKWCGWNGVQGELHGHMLRIFCDLLGMVAGWVELVAPYELHRQRTGAKWDKKRADVAARVLKSRDAAASQAAGLAAVRAGDLNASVVVVGRNTPKQSEQSAFRTAPKTPKNPGTPKNPKTENVTLNRQTDRKTDREKDPPESGAQRAQEAAAAYGAAAVGARRGPDAVGFVSQTDSNGRGPSGAGTEPGESPTFQAMRRVLARLGLTAAQAGAIVGSVASTCKTNGRSPRTSAVLNPIANVMFVLERNRDPGKARIGNVVAWVLAGTGTPSAAKLDRADEMLRAEMERAG